MPAITELSNATCRRHRRLPDGPGANPLPRLCRPQGLLPPGGGHCGRGGARISARPTTLRTTQYAHTLGLAFQLTNIIRDVGEDAMLGRIYLPVSELQQFDVKAHGSRSARIPTVSPPSCAFRPSAHRLYDGRWPVARRRPPRPKPGLMMASIYRTLLREIEHDNFQVLHQRIRLTALRKFWLAWKVQALGRM